MKRFWLKFYLIVEYILSLVWFVLGTLFYVFLVMYVTDDCFLCMVKTYGIRYLFSLACLLLSYVFVSYCLISSIISTHKLLKDGDFTTKNKIIMSLTALINIGIISLTFYMFFHK